MTSYKPRGVCSSNIEFDIDDQGLVRNISFADGCPGTSIGLARLAEGRPSNELIELFKDVPCGKKKTSCPAQLATALAEELESR